MSKILYMDGRCVTMEQHSRRGVTGVDAPDPHSQVTPPVLPGDVYHAMVSTYEDYAAAGDGLGGASTSMKRRMRERKRLSWGRLTQDIATLNAAVLQRTTEWNLMMCDPTYTGQRRRTTPIVWAPILMYAGTGKRKVKLHVLGSPGAAISVQRSPSHGWGLRANRDFDAGEYVTQYYGWEVSTDEAVWRMEHVDKGGSHLCGIKSGLRVVLDGLRVPISGLGGGSFANEAPCVADANCVLDRDVGLGSCVVLVSTRPVPRNTWFMTTYSRNRGPGSLHEICGHGDHYRMVQQ